MVANLSIGRKDLMNNYDSFIAISENCQNFKDIFLELIDKDSKAYDDVCLLYTSPSPRDKRQSRMPSSA